MVKNLLKYSLRSLQRQKSYVIINVIGLAFGLACSLVIFLFVSHELSYDKHFENKDRVYRVILEGKLGGQEVTVVSTASPIGPTMRNEFPEVEEFTRINGWGETIIKYQEKSFTEKAFIEADSAFFKVFSIPLIRGNKEKILNIPHTAVVSVSTARKMFGEEDPIGKMIQAGTDSTLYRVTGVMEDIPENTHFSANIIGSFMTNPRADDNQWLSNSFNTYVLLYPNADASSVDGRFKGMIEKYVGPEITRFLGISIEEFLSAGNKYNMFLQPLLEIHLDPSIEQDLKAANDPRYLYIFGAIAILIIIIAAINFMNLSTAQASKRAKEISIKKVSGSTRGMLISQFLTETILLSFLSLLLALLVVELTLPYISELLGQKLQIKYLGDWYTIPGLIVLMVIVGIIAGSYPAFYLSSFNPYEVLKGNFRSGRGSKTLRRILVIFQFSISIILIVGTMIMYRQISYMQNKDLGWDKEQLLVIRRASVLGNKIDTFKKEIKGIAGVINASASTAVPGHNNNNNGYMIKGRAEESFLLETNWVDFDYLDTYGMELSDGRFFDESFATDEDACLVNEIAVKHYNLVDPFATKFLFLDEETQEDGLMPIIGVVKDFHYQSLQKRIGPYMMRFKNEDMNWGYISVRLNPVSVKSTMQEIESTWNEYTGNVPMRYFFMDLDFARLYKEERQNAILSILFTILGILIAALGLYGLTSFTVAQRTKEIGVRKTFGASIGNIWYLISKEILTLIVISTVISWPLIYWVASNWLANYHYRIELGIFEFLAGFLISVIIALATISYRALKAASANPSLSLRYE